MSATQTQQTQVDGFQEVVRIGTIEENDRPRDFFCAIEYSDDGRRAVSADCVGADEVEEVGMVIQSVAVAWLDRMPVLVLTGERGGVRVVGADPVLRVLQEVAA